MPLYMLTTPSSSWRIKAEVPTHHVISDLMVFSGNAHHLAQRLIRRVECVQIFIKGDIA